MTKRKETIQEEITTKINNELEDLGNIENYIGEILDKTNYDCVNLKNIETTRNIKTSKLSLLGENAQFISINVDSLTPYSQIITEKEFFKIVCGNSKRVYKRAGNFQASLHSNYLKAIEENDAGYIKDVLSRAVILKNNMNYAKRLERNTKFMKEWRNNFTELTPLEEIKRSGSLRKINIIKARI